MSRSGWTRICVDFSSPPNTSAPATPGTDNRLGRIVHLAIVRSFISDCRSEVMPITRMVAPEDVIGIIAGACTPTGNWLASVARRSATCWRSR